MNIIDLKSKLDDLKVNENDYSLNTLKPNRYIITHEDLKWLTFFSDEYNNITEFKQFEKEEEACQDLINRLIHLKQWRLKYNINPNQR